MLILNQTLNLSIPQLNLSDEFDFLVAEASGDTILTVEGDGDIIMTQGGLTITEVCVTLSESSIVNDAFIHQT